MSWIEVRIKVSETLKEAVSNRLFELGALGIEDIQGDGGLLQIRSFFDIKSRETVSRDLEKYLSSLSELFPALSPCDWEFSNLKEENWASKHKDFFKAQELSKSFFLRPVWDVETIVPRGKNEIRMDLGQAFGTGLHPSTRLCVNLLEKVARYYGDLKSVRLIDVGTGAGILSIVAHKLGVGDITAIDIDPVAIEEARKNFDVNGCGGIKLELRQLGEFKKSFNIIVSNILLETHLGLAGHYRSLLFPGGQLILSGLLNHQKDEMDELLLSMDFKVEQLEFFQEWTARLYASSRFE